MYTDNMLIIDSMMYHLAGDIYIFVPAFLNVSDESDTFNFYALKVIYVIEIIAIAVSLPTTLFLNYCLSRSTILHPNIARITQVFLSGYYFGIIGRVVILFYQIDIVHYNESSLSSKVPLFVASIIRLWYFSTTLVVLGEMIVERTFASYLVIDYEKKPRIWISTGIIAISTPTTFLFTVSIMIRVYSALVFVVGCTVCVAVFVIILMAMYRRDLLRLRELRSGVHNTRTLNTLSIKFQLMENLRIMRLVMLAYCIASVLIIISLTLIAVAVFVFERQPELGRLCFAVLDLFVALSSAIGFFAFLRFFGEWRRVMRECGFVKKFCSGLTQRLHSPKRKDRINDRRGDTEHYFEQLRQAWE